MTSNNRMQLNSEVLPLNGIARSNEADCHNTCLLHRVEWNQFEFGYFLSNIYVDISIRFTCMAGGACMLWEQVSRFCNIYVLSRPTDAASGGFHPEGCHYKCVVKRLLNDTLTLNLKIKSYKQEKWKFRRSNHIGSFWPYTVKAIALWKMFDNPTDNHTDPKVTYTINLQS